MHFAPFIALQIWYSEAATLVSLGKGARLLQANLAMPPKPTYILASKSSHKASSNRQVELLALQNLRVVNVEEVRVQNRLDDASQNGNWINITVCEVPIYPVGDVEGTVNAEGEQVVCGDVLCFPCALKHEELGEDRNRLEPDGESPQHLQSCVPSVSSSSRSFTNQDRALTSEGMYLYGNNMPIAALAASKYSTLNVSRFGSCVGL